MAQIIKPTKIRIVPRDGELEITVNINVNVDGKVTTDDQQKEEKDIFIVPDFGSGMKLSFGKT